MGFGLLDGYLRQDEVCTYRISLPWEYIPSSNIYALKWGRAGVTGRHYMVERWEFVEGVLAEEVRQVAKASSGYCMHEWSRV